MHDLLCLSSLDKSSGTDLGQNISICPCNHCSCCAAASREAISGLSDACALFDSPHDDANLGHQSIYKPRGFLRRTSSRHSIYGDYIIMSIEQMQAEDKKVSSVEMAPLEKHNFVEVGEVSEINEEDIGTHVQCIESPQSADEFSRC